MCIIKHNYRLGGMLFTICKAQLHVSATNVGHLQAVERKLINHTCICRECVGYRGGRYKCEISRVSGVGALCLSWLGTMYRQSTMPT